MRMAEEVQGIHDHGFVWIGLVLQSTGGSSSCIMWRLVVLFKGIVIFLISRVRTLDSQAKVVFLQLYMPRLNFSTETVKLFNSTWL